MATLLKSVLLVSGRFLAENPYREVIVKRLLERRGVEVKFVMPGRILNKGAALESVMQDPVFQREGMQRIDGEWDFRKSMRGCQMVVFSAWRSYLPLARLVQAEGRPTINFCATSGLDHWIHGVERCLTRSVFTHRLMQYEHKTMGATTLPDEQIRVVGSMQYEYLDDEDRMIFHDRDSFCSHYGLMPDRPVVVLFPKGIQSFHHKVSIWFRDWDQSRVDQYNQFFLDKYGEICRKVKEAGCNLIVKMHPTAYAAYNCNTQFEYTFWQQYPWIKVLEPEHTLAMYRFADVGVGINSHSALDMGYFKKPFIYVDSDLMGPPDLPIFDIFKLSRLPPGPSTHWHAQSAPFNPWFPSWLGAFSRAEDLPNLLANFKSSLVIKQEDWEAFITEYWGMHDNKASERIVDEILMFGQERLSSWRHKLSWRHWYGALYDLKG